MELLTVPALIRLRHLVQGRRRAHGTTALPGGLVTKRKGAGLETADLRPFSHGDDPRHIDRNATARTGVPQVRTFHAEQDRVLILIADFRPSMLWGTRRTLRSVAAAEVLCLNGWQGVGDGGRVGLIAATAGDPVLTPPKGRDRGMISVIGAMVRAHEAAVAAPAVSDPPLADTLAMAARIVPRGAEIVLATAFDAPGDAFADASQALNRRGDLRILRITDPFETRPPRDALRFSTRRGVGGTGRLTGAPPDPVAGLGLNVHPWDSSQPPGGMADV